MPKGIIAHLIVRMNEYIERQGPQDLSWEKGVVLQRGSTRAKIEQEISKEGLKIVDIALQGPDTKEFLTLIREEIDRINRRFQKIPTEKLIPCNCTICLNDENPSFYEFSELKDYIAGNKETIFCRKSKLDVAIKEMLEGLVEKWSPDGNDFRKARWIKKDDEFVEALNRIGNKIEKLPEDIQKRTKTSVWIKAGLVITAIAAIVGIIWIVMQRIDNFGDKNKNVPDEKIKIEEQVKPIQSVIQPDSTKAKKDSAIVKQTD